MNENELQDIINQIKNTRMQNYLKECSYQIAKLTQQRALWDKIIERFAENLDRCQKQIAARNTTIAARDTTISELAIDSMALAKISLQLQQDKASIRQELRIKLETMDLELKEWKDLVGMLKKELQQAKSEKIISQPSRILTLGIPKIDNYKTKLQRENKQLKEKVQNISERLEQQKKTSLKMTQQRNKAREMYNENLQQSQKLQSRINQFKIDVESLEISLEATHKKMNTERQMIFLIVQKKLEELQLSITELPPGGIKTQQLQPLNETDTPMGEDNQTGSQTLVWIEQGLHYFLTFQQDKIKKLQEQWSSMITNHSPTLAQSQSLTQSPNTITQEGLKEQNQTIKGQLKQSQEANKQLSSKIDVLQKIKVHNEKSIHEHQQTLQKCQEENNILKLQIDQQRQVKKNQLPKHDIILLVEKFLTINRENSIKIKVNCGMSQNDRVVSQNNQINELVIKIKQFMLSKNIL